MVWKYKKKTKKTYVQNKNWYLFKKLSLKLNIVDVTEHTVRSYWPNWLNQNDLFQNHQTATNRKKPSKT